MAERSYLFDFLVGRAGLEPATNGLKDDGNLSYSSINQALTTLARVPNQSHSLGNQPHHRPTLAQNWHSRG